jgi:hypothetical protein
MRVSDWAQAVPLPSNHRSGASTPTRLLLYRPCGHDGTWPHCHARTSRRRTVLTRFRPARHRALDKSQKRAAVRASARPPKQPPSSLSVDCPNRDIGSHAFASALETRAKAKAGLDRRVASVALVAGGTARRPSESQCCLRKPIGIARVVVARTRARGQSLAWRCHRADRRPFRDR